ncbi:hypothetical protein [Colwellia sp. PAMC 21821]|uniref:hypothetical protein n=1 Tax=Colwellia sp. PAMC 21821 TaxID=1816219 RepID=UPI0009BE5A1B|nr:hypothetical protein [Colwellia sp. PAMC 21821]ARD44448.1 hypothetical protein A3Q33_09095 [Colwellia sp. PAMC 21821]
MFKNLIILIFFSFCCLGKEPVNAIALTDEKIILNVPTPLIGVTAVDDFSSAIEEPNASAGGAMEMQRYFTVTVLAKLKNCQANTRTVFQTWYTGHGLIPSQEKIDEYSMVIRIWDKDKNGIFEAKYELNQAESYVRSSLDYYQKSGKKLPIETITEMIEHYQLSLLWQTLSEAMSCD